MRSLVVFLILVGIVVLVPHAFANCISLSCDDANNKLGEPNYRFIDFSFQNKVGESIRFVLEKTAYDHCNSYIATITNEKEETIWEQKDASLCVTTDNQDLMTSQIKLGYLAHNPIIINESGKYLLKVQIDDGSIEREFVVRENFSGFSADRTVHPVPWYNSPLKQFKSGTSFSEIKCNSGLQLTQRYDGHPACVKPDTYFELIKRGWVSNIIKAIQSRDISGIDPTSSYMEKITPTLDEFKETFSKSNDIETIFSKFGKPHNDIGSGIHIYVYELDDSTQVWIGYADHIWYVQHVDSDGNVLEKLFEENEN